MARFIFKRIGDNMFFESTLTIPIKTPKFPEFLHKFNIEIKTPSILDLTASYKPITKEIILFDPYKQITKGLITDNQLTITVPRILKNQIKEYINYIFFDQNRLFQWFAEQDNKNPKNQFPIAVRLMLEPEPSQNNTLLLYNSINNIPEGITTVDNTLIIHNNDEIIFLSPGYILKLKLDKKYGVGYYTITQCHLIKPTLETYEECHRISQWLASK